MLLFVWLALSPCLRKWGKAESFVGSWQFQCGLWASSPRDMVSRWGDGLSPVLGCFPLVWSGLVRSGRHCFSGGGRVGSLVLGGSPLCSWPYDDVLLLPRFGHMMFYFCLDFVCAKNSCPFRFRGFGCAFWLDNSVGKLAAFLVLVWLLFLQCACDVVVSRIVSESSGFFSALI